MEKKYQPCSVRANPADFLRTQWFEEYFLGFFAAIKEGERWRERGEEKRKGEENLREWDGGDEGRTEKKSKEKDILIELFVFLKHNLLFHES